MLPSYSPTYLPYANTLPYFFVSGPSHHQGSTNIPPSSAHCEGHDADGKPLHSNASSCYDSQASLETPDVTGSAYVTVPVLIFGEEEEEEEEDNARAHLAIRYSFTVDDGYVEQLTCLPRYSPT
ncbi:uncharacterized protein GGS25DRAFT_252275 [Hypoxylon fragiforme]|uniref:uncharacterized protein n=1 Tax=Hypoxylon fragiforme TaxID=63214 RepID=UPI0020C5B900|nr:uncharacterized protein GGS25DRAFT_252275 [Hypoxylon fragiforme]KAI2610213.1 hypothetical protein GGS25DRAFT_252275 [Hypoxylon fragiforme]